MTAPHDPKRVVADGYDQIAERYAAWGATGVRETERDFYTTVLLDALPVGADVLELGCGAGIPTTQRLAERFAVTGIDISARQIALARRNVPDATFIHADMTALDIRARVIRCGLRVLCVRSCAARGARRAAASRSRRWLRPAGLFVASFSNEGSAGEIDDDWLGAPMYFSGYDAETNAQLVRDAGFVIVTARPETAEEFGRPTTFFWIVARKAAETYQRRQAQ